MHLLHIHLLSIVTADLWCHGHVFLSATFTSHQCKLININDYFSHFYTLTAQCLAPHHMNEMCCSPALNMLTKSSSLNFTECWCSHSEYTSEACTCIQVISVMPKTLHSKKMSIHMCTFLLIQQTQDCLYYIFRFLHLCSQDYIYFP